MKTSGHQRVGGAPAIPGAGPRRRADGVAWAATLAIAAVLAAWLPALVQRGFDPDEFEHVHASWCVAQGLLPYRDFFEHHTPWYYYGLSLVLRGFDVARSYESARHFLLVGRGLSLLVTVVSVALLVWLGTHWQGRKVGVLAGLLLVLQPMFFDKSIELRPDVPALALFLGSLCLLLAGMEREGRSPARRRLEFAAAGLSLGAAIMCTQKTLFVLPGLGVGLALWSLRPEPTVTTARGPDASADLRLRSRLALVLLFLVGVCVPGGVTWAAFALHHAGAAFLTDNFLLNARWKPIETHQLAVLLWTSWPVLVLGAVGAMLPLLCALRGAGISRQAFLLLGTLAGLLAGAYAIPSAWAQYYLMPLPLVCLFAAHALVVVVERAGRARHLLLVLALLGLAVLPARKLRHALDQRNDAQLARLRHVLETTRPDEIVMDGWQGTGVFRPHAFHYFFLHRETLAMLPPRELALFLGALERGAIRPSLIAVDRHLWALGPRFHSFVRTRYESTDGFFYAPRRFWRSDPGGLLRQVGGL